MGNGGSFHTIHKTQQAPWSGDVQPRLGVKSELGDKVAAVAKCHFLEIGGKPGKADNLNTGLLSYWKPSSDVLACDSGG